MSQCWRGCPNEPILDLCYICPNSGHLEINSTPLPALSIQLSFCRVLRGQGFSQIVWWENYANQGKDKLKIISLVLCMPKSIWYSSCIAIMDSNFCIFKGLIELGKHEVYGLVLIKKRQYWPRYIKGDELDRYFEEKQIGNTDCLPGRLVSVPFYIFCMKE